MVTVPKPYDSAKHVKMATPFLMFHTFYKYHLLYNKLFEQCIFGMLQIPRMFMSISNDKRGVTGDMILPLLLVNT